MKNSRTWGSSRIVFLSLAAVCAVIFSMLVSSGSALAVDQGVKAHNVPGSDYECDGTEWHFVINQIDEEANAPASIHVEWANGNTEEIPLDKFSGGVAHYATTSNLDSTVVIANAVIYELWGGQFNLSHGPCNEETTPTNTPEYTPTNTPENTPTNTPENTPTNTPENTPTNTPGITTTATQTGGEEETPIPSETPTDVPTETATSTADAQTNTPADAATSTPTDPVDELPNTGASPSGRSGSGIMAALVLALGLAGMGWLVRQRSAQAGR